jgi:hypothetical protein
MRATVHSEAEPVVVLIQMLLPTRSSEGTVFPDDLLRTTRQELIDRFGGLTAYTRAPATGVWTSPERGVEVDSVVMIEVLSEVFDTTWWRSYAETLKERFRQETIHIRANDVYVLEN